MASPTWVNKTISLEEFLRLPEIDEHPYLEYINGRIEAKVSPQKKHGVIEKRLMTHVDAYSEPRQLGATFPELRCTFAGRSIIPDVVFLLDEHIEADASGEVLDPTLRPPDIRSGPPWNAGSSPRMTCSAPSSCGPGPAQHWADSLPDRRV